MTSRLKSESSTCVLGMKSWLQPTNVSSARPEQSLKEADKGFTGIKTPAPSGLFRRAHTAKTHRAGQASCSAERFQATKAGISWLFAQATSAGHELFVQQWASGRGGQQQREAALLELR